MRRHEGTALGQVLSQRLVEIGALAARAEAAPGRQPEAIKKKLAEQIATLLGRVRTLRSRPSASGGDPDRQQGRHPRGARPARVPCRQARKLMAEGGAIGRRLDFLSQELNRETNTLCAKSNDVELTNIGLELKTVVEQFREQVQNLECAWRERAIQQTSQGSAIARRGIMLVVVLALGRGQDHAVAHAARRRSDRSNCRSPSPRARSAPAKSTVAITVHRHAGIRSDGRSRANLLEWAEVFGQCYGTPREPVETAFAGTGRDVLFDIDWQGTQQLARQGRARSCDASSCCRRSINDLEAPAASRAQDSDAVIARAHGESSRRNQPLGRIRLRDRQPRHRQALRASCARSSPPSGSSASARPDYPGFRPATLLGESVRRRSID